MKTRISLTSARPRIVFWLVISLLTAGLFCTASMRADAAACPPQAIDYGTVTNTVNLPAAATYRVWTHMYVPNTTNNTYLLQVADQCFTIGGSSTAPGSWKWVASQDGTSAMADVPLAAGSQTITLIGSKPDVKVDRVIFAADLACVPTNDGSNCNTPADTTAPSVQLTDPQSGSTVSGSVIVAATASDNIGVTRVEFYVNGALLDTDTTAPYSVNWDTLPLSNGDHTLGVKAYDAAGNTAQNSYRVTIQNGDTKAPSVPTSPTATAPAYNAVHFSWGASSDNVGVTGYTVWRDGMPLGDVTGTSYTDTAVHANTSYAYQVVAYDAAGNRSAASAKATVTTPTVPDTQAPTPPTALTASAVSANQINLSWSVSTDNTGVVGYDVYRATGTSGMATKIATTQTLSLADANLAASTTYTYYVKARDSNNNQSPASSSATATTQAIPSKKHRHTRVTGKVSNSRTGVAVPYATLSLQASTGRQDYVSDRHGKYRITGLEPGSYTLSVQAQGYKPASITIRADKNGGHIVKDVKLTKQQVERSQP